MSVYKRGKVYWFKFVWKGELIRESTKQGNAVVARQMEAARRTQLAKGEVGIHDQKAAPTLAEFAEQSFIPFVETKKKGKPRTVAFYKTRVSRLKTFPRLWNSRLDCIQPEDIRAYIESRQALGMETSTINRDLATLRRMFKLATEWKHVSTVLPKISLLPDENQRERVVLPDEEQVYLAAAPALLRDFAILEFDCGLRPEEGHRLQWVHIRNGNVEVHKGKTKHARRSIPASKRVLQMLARRRSETESEWVFPAPTKTGHINADSLKKQHATAIKKAGIEPFVPYSWRHTCLTRWAESGMDAFRLKRLAGHADISTTLRYIHMNDKGDREAMAKVWEAQGGHKIGHSHESAA